MNNARIERLKMGDWQFGCAGRHNGIGTDDCPRTLHHHHDDFCPPPTLNELKEAGINPKDFQLRSRAGSRRY
jgi:hypothetical protein